MNERLRHLIERAPDIAADETPRRRIELVERATSDGHSIEYADLIYDIAEEEGIDPALAFELVLNGIGVRELAPPNDDRWVETQVEAPPKWVTEPRTAPAAAAPERHMRTTFRRLRSLIEQHGSLRAALEAFAQQPDVAEMKY
jgi:hypothetical protein